MPERPLADAVRPAAPPLATAPAGEQRWVPSHALKATAALHAGAAVALAATPCAWAPIAAVLAANHLALLAAGLAPRSALLGPNLVRLPDAAVRRGEVALTFDDGPDPAVTPRVLDALDAYAAQATFFCVGARAAAHPDLVREIARRGHGVENHSLHHSTAFGWYGLRRLRRELEGAQAILAPLAGRLPGFFRAPFGARSPLLDPVLARLGLRLVSWTRRGYDTVARAPADVLRRLARDLAAGDILVLHDGVATGARRDVRAVLDVLPALLERVRGAGLVPVTLSAACRE